MSYSPATGMVECQSRHRPSRSLLTSCLLFAGRFSMLTIVKRFRVLSWHPIRMAAQP